MNLKFNHEHDPKTGEFASSALSALKDETQHLQAGKLKEVEQLLNTLAIQFPGVIGSPYGIQTVKDNAEDYWSGAEQPVAGFDAKRNSMVVNPLYFGDDVEARKKAEEDAKSGWRVGSSPEDAIIHEFGHAVQNVMINSDDEDIQTVVSAPQNLNATEKLSRYAVSGGWVEAFAEAFTWIYKHPGETPPDDYTKSVAEAMRVFEEKASIKALPGFLKYNHNHDHSNGEFATSDSGSEGSQPKPTNSTQEAKKVPKQLSAISFELAPGEGSPKLAKALGDWDSFNTEEQHTLTQAVVDPLLPLIQKESRKAGYDVVVRKPTYGSGAWMTTANPSSVVEVEGDEKAASWVMDRIGASLEQTGMFGHRVDPMGSAQFVDVQLPELDKPLDLATTRKFWAAALDADKASKTPGHLDQLGASPMMISMNSGQKSIAALRIINGDGTWSEEQIDELRRGGGILHQAANAVGLTSQRVSGNATTLWRDNDWTTQKNGENYRTGEEYTASGRSGRSGSLSSRSPGLSEQSLDYHLRQEVVERTRAAVKRVLAARSGPGHNEHAQDLASAAKALDWPSFLKFNPNHDDLGRFAQTGVAPQAVASTVPTGPLPHDYPVPTTPLKPITSEIQQMAWDKLQKYASFLVAPGVNTVSNYDKMYIANSNLGLVAPLSALASGISFQSANNFPVPSVPLLDLSTVDKMDLATWNFLQTAGKKLAADPSNPDLIEKYTTWYGHAQDAGLVTPLADLNAPKVAASTTDPYEVAINSKLVSLISGDKMTNIQYDNWADILQKQMEYQQAPVGSLAASDALYSFTNYYKSAVGKGLIAPVAVPAPKVAAPVAPQATNPGDAYQETGKAYDGDLHDLTSSVYHKNEFDYYKSWLALEQKNGSKLDKQYIEEQMLMNADKLVASGHFVLKSAPQAAAPKYLLDQDFNYNAALLSQVTPAMEAAINSISIAQEDAQDHPSKTNLDKYQALVDDAFKKGLIKPPLSEIQPSPTAAASPVVGSGYTPDTFDLTAWVSPTVPLGASTQFVNDVVEAKWQAQHNPTPDNFKLFEELMQNGIKDGLIKSKVPQAAAPKVTITHQAPGADFTPAVGDESGKSYIPPTGNEVYVALRAHKVPSRDDYSNAPRLIENEILQDAEKDPRVADIVGQGHGSDVEAKKVVARRLADRLKGNPEWKKLVDAMSVITKQQSQDPDFVPATQTMANGLLNYSSDVSENLAGSLVGQWAASSFDSNPLSIAIQRAASREFNCPAPKSVDDSTQKDTETVDRVFGKALRAFVRAQYDETQEMFKRIKVNKVLLLRGIELGGKGMSNSNAEHFAPMDKKFYTGRYISDTSGPPLSSWSTTSSIAYGFGHHLQNGAVAAAFVPVKDIVSTPYTGSGCLSETEMVLKPGKAPALIYLKTRPKNSSSGGGYMDADSFWNGLDNISTANSPTIRTPAPSTVTKAPVPPKAVAIPTNKPYHEQPLAELNTHLALGFADMSKEQHEAWGQVTSKYWDHYDNITQHNKEALQQAIQKAIVAGVLKPPA